MLAENRAALAPLVPLGFFVLEGLFGCGPILSNIPEEAMTPPTTVICGEKGGIYPDCSILVDSPPDTPESIPTSTRVPPAPTPEGLTGMEAVNEAMDQGQNPEYPSGAIAPIPQ